MPTSELSDLDKMKVVLLNLAARVANDASKDEVMGMIADLLDHCHALETK